MGKRFLRRFSALFAACSLILATGFPALAAPTAEELGPGTYTVTGVLIDIPNPAEELGLSPERCSLSGPDVSEDGTLFLESGKTYNFTWQQTLPIDAETAFGANIDSGKGCSTLASYNNNLFLDYIPLDGKSLFGIPAEGAQLEIMVSYRNVSLLEGDSVYIPSDSRYPHGPYLFLSGGITVTIRTTIGATFTTDIDDMELQMLYDFLPLSAAANAVWLDTPQEATFRFTLDGTLECFDGEFEYQTAPAVMHSTFDGRGDYSYTVSFGGGSYTNTLIDCNEHTNTNDFYCLTGYMNFRALDWSVAPYDSTSDAAPDTTPETETETTLATAATITAGASAAALGGSALSNVLGDTLANSAMNFSTPDTPAPSSAVPEQPPADLPTDDKKKYLPDGEENDSPVSGDGDAPDETNSSYDDHSASGEPQTISEEDAAPDLPEEDSPEVSMSLYAPGKDILNTKGGAIDITATVKGGEGYLWHYIPAVIVPGAAKAIIPIVAGQTELTTLVLNITGAKLEERHHAVFVNLIAWAMTPDGKLLKTSASMEMKLHEKGLEAKRGDDDSLTVTVYGETTLKGYAEIRILSADEYTCTEQEDGKLHIQAVDENLGNTTI